MPVTTINLGEFTQAAALDYLNNSEVTAGLSEDEKAKLVFLTRGHPLWLAFTIDYLREKGMPRGSGGATGRVSEDVPYGEAMTPRGQSLHEEFQRRLVTPYREADFWHEAIKRLAVVRQSVNKVIWQALMADRPLPAGAADLDAAWDQLLRNAVDPAARQSPLRDAARCGGRRAGTADYPAA